MPRWDYLHSDDKPHFNSSPKQLRMTHGVQFVQSELSRITEPDNATVRRYDRDPTINFLQMIV